MPAFVRKAARHAAMPVALLASVAPASAAWAQVVPAPPAPAAAPADDYPPPEEAKAAPDINPVAITALVTGGKLSFDKLGQPVTVITQDDLDRIQGGNFVRVLTAIPGATWERRGGPGAQTGLHLRGAGIDEVLVLIDGVRMQDVGAPGAGFDFGTLMAAGIDRVDVLRGANSVVWGSGAVGGVVAVTTRETKGLMATAEAGGHDSALLNLAAGVKKDRYALALDGGYVATDGTGGARNAAAGGFHQWRLGGRGRVSLTDALSLTALARFADSKLTGDAFALPPDLAGTVPEGLRTQQVSGRVGAHYEHGGVTLDSGYALSTTRRVYDLAPASGPTATQAISRGTSERADLTGSVRLPAGFAVNFGTDDEWDRSLASRDGIEHHTRIDSGHVLLGWYGPVATLAAGARVDNSSQFGSHDSFSANGSVKLVEGVRLRASYAESFKAPSLYELTSIYGNGALMPETADSYDAGVDFSGNDGRVQLSASVYRRDSRNLIELADLTRCGTEGRPACAYANVGAARAQGLELEAALVPSEKWRLSAIYSYTHATNRTPGDADYGKDLPRRPREAVTAKVDWTSPLLGIVFGADVQVQAASWDDAANSVRLHTSELTTLRATLPFGNFFDVYARVEDLFNDHNPTVAGYGTLGRNILIGARVRY